MSQTIDLSVVIPTLNEISNVETLLGKIISDRGVTKEIIIVDGGSTDGTRERVLHLARRFPNVYLIENPEKYVSHGFNKALRFSSGKYISLIGAHSIYPENYFKKCMEVIESGLCDAAGGFLVQRGKTESGMAISVAMSSKFGVGNTEFRTERKRQYVDSVAFAVYKREIFDDVGGLDEDLIRNQDDEFHYRLNKAGYKILMLPDLEVIYLVRNSFSSLYSQYYQYGFYKPLVFKKVKGSIKLRHLIPLCFVIYLFSLPITLLLPYWISPLMLYVLLSFYFGFKSNFSFLTKLKTVVAFPVLHFSYGYGFFKRIISLSL